jgi:hypothetical protein
MKVKLITQHFLLRIIDIELFGGQVLLEPFKILGRGRSISTNITIISKITAFNKNADKYVVEL